MSFHTNTRIPVDDTYAALVGKAVYMFAYYEWTIIWIMELLTRGGFVSTYCRGRTMTSGCVMKELKKIIGNTQTDFSKISRQELHQCCDEFDRLIIRRNALIHAHPCTDPDGSQILAYQAKPTNPLPDMKWPREEVEAFVLEVDRAACDAGVLLDKLR